MVEEAAPDTSADNSLSQKPAAKQTEPEFEAKPPIDQTETDHTPIDTKQEPQPDEVERDTETKPSVPAETPTDIPQSSKPQNVSSQDLGPKFPDLPTDHPLSQLLSRLPTIIESADHAEVWGVDVSNPASGHTKNILQKFLRANANDVAKAEEQLLGTLKWRKEFQPLRALDDELHSREKFGGLGFVTTLTGVPGCEAGEEQVVTWNVYGAVRDNKATFGDLDSFLRWRVALMELSLRRLNLASARTAIPDYTPTPTAASQDPYQAIQVHDYRSVSFLRPDPLVKAASRRTVDLFAAHYPETLRRKFFVNVPWFMGWVFAAFKKILPAETLKKFSVLSDGAALAAELGPGVPVLYGGKGVPLRELGEETRLS